MKKELSVEQNINNRNNGDRSMDWMAGLSQV